MVNEFVSILQRHNPNSPRGNDKAINHTPELFVETYLHRFLADEILSGKYKLVLITGCSGDGKTDFIQWLESERMGEQVDLATKPVGRYDWITYKDLNFCTLYDAGMTFEEEGQSPEELLHDNLDDFAGEDWNEEPQCYRIFSINRDLLRSFLTIHKEKYPRLGRCVNPAIDDISPDPTHALKEGILVVDLTLRSLFGDILREEGLTDGCLYTQLVEKLCDPKMWAGCEGCEAFEHCPIRHNVLSLNPAGGKPVAERLQMLLTAFHYRRIFHLTMRDLVGFLVHTFVTDVSCEEIIKSVGDPDFLFPLLYFNRAFDFPGDFGELLKEIDIAAVGAPDVDSTLLCEEDLALNSDSTSVMVIRDLLDSLDSRESAHEASAISKAIFEARKRRYFFEGAGEEWRELFPYRSYELFDSIAKKQESITPALVGKLLYALSLRDSITPPTRGTFYFTLDGDLERVATYYSAPFSDFEMILPLPRAIAGHREFLPGYLLLRHKEAHTIQLRINLDIFEFITYGSFNLPEKPDYSSEIRHRLRLFKEKLENKKELRSFILRAENGLMAEVLRRGMSGGEIKILRGE
ncbi:MAG: hypothetical protein WC712_11385 [Candidatus Brocadiia bacterium]